MSSKMKVIKRNGKQEDVSFDKILHRIKKLITDKLLGNLDFVHSDIISQEVISKLYDGVTTEELDNLTASIAIEKSLQHSNYEILAARVAVSNLHKKTTECFSSVIEKLYHGNIAPNGEKTPLVSEEIFNIVKKHKKKLNFVIDYLRDYSLNYLGFKTLEKSYLLKINGQVIERPQHLLMRVALGIHKEDIEKAIETYKLMSTGYFIHATPTLFNAGTNRSSLSSCFLLDIDDSMEGIYKCLSDCAIISKNAGGIGISVSDIRSEGSYIRGTNGRADGIVKMLKVFNETARYANQGSKRNGSIAMYIEPWHADIFEFLNMRRNTGDENLKCRDLFTALWVPDAFMRAVEKDEDWYLMSSSQSPRLSEVYGEEFDMLYYSYVNTGKYMKKIKARDLWNEILITQIETGMPYVSYKDHANKKSNQKNIGTIKSSNLCVHPDTKILTKNGYHKIKELENKEIKVWNGKEFSDTIVQKTGENQEMLKVVLDNGKEVICTFYHKFFIKKGNEIIKVDAQNLQENDELLTCDYPTIDYNKQNDNYTNPDQPYLYQMVPPVNYDVATKIQWLQGLMIKHGVVNDDEITLSFDNCYKSSINNLRDIGYMLNTLGADFKIKEETSWIFYRNYKLIIPRSSVYKLTKLKFFHPDVKCIFPVEKRCVKVKNIFKDYNTDTYCFKESKRGMGVFNGILTGNCNEIYIASTTEEYGTCNIATLGLSKYINKNEAGNPIYDFKKLYEVTRVMVRNLNNVIDNNYYPVKETEISNLNHRPIAIGVQGLANTFFSMRYPFESKEAKDLNKKIFETIQFAALTESKNLAKQHGPYSTFTGSPASKGLFQHNLWGLKDEELSGIWDWDALRKEVKTHGLRNSLLTACPPTASTSQILGNYESFEPVTNNMFIRSTLSGDYPVVNHHLINDLNKIGLWTPEVRNSIMNSKGSIQHIDKIPKSIRQLYKTVWEVPQKTLMELSADRGAFIDHSQSLNLFFESPTPNKLNAAHFHGWRLGLKTSMYYCRTRTKSEAQKFTVEVSKDVEKLLCSLETPESCMMCSG